MQRTARKFARTSRAPRASIGHGPRETDNGVMTGADDATLARAAQAGDATGLGVLFERHRARLHAVAVGMLGHGPDADDAVQDTVVIAMRRIGDLREPAAARGWLVAILVNVCRAHLRRPARELPGADAVERNGAIDTVQEAVERGALRDWVWTALERLPEPQRVAVMLRYFSTASSYGAIAEICDVPVGTVRSRLNAARSRLADELLSTAAAAHTERDTVRAWSLANGAAMLAFQRSGDPALIESVFSPDVAFRMADRVERRGRADLAAELADDFEDGVTARPLRVIPGEHVAIVELLLESPPEQPLHCPPAVTQVHLHDAGRTHRLISTTSRARSPRDSGNKKGRRGETRRP
jgi:RNA polymerase sigma factor (sigma-70 family)